MPHGIASTTHRVTPGQVTGRQISVLIQAAFEPGLPTPDLLVRNDQSCRTSTVATGVGDNLADRGSTAQDSSVTFTGQLDRGLT